jgi:hypothetical protein
MLQSARVHPFSSYLLVNRELHLEGHGFVVLRGIIFSSKMALIWALVSNGNKLEKNRDHNLSHSDHDTTSISGADG